MPRRGLGFEPGMFLHVFNRGANRDRVFFERRNYEFFLRRARTYLRPPGIQAIAYCLMPNHFHLLLRVDEDVLSKSIQRLLMSYANAVNLAYARSGPVFTGRYRALPVHSDRHLIHLSAYIHLNPCRAGLVDSPSDWDFSSYREYTGARHDPFVDPRAVLDRFSTASGQSTPAFSVTYEAYVRGVLELGKGGH